MYKLFILSYLLLTNTGITQVDLFDLTVTVSNIKKSEGSIVACIVQDQTKFLKDCDEVITISADESSHQITFKNIKKGTYAIVVFHDIDNNEELNRDGLFGMPSEPSGFSNNPKVIFGPPSFSKCAVSVEQDSSINIKL